MKKLYSFHAIWPILALALIIVSNQIQAQNAGIGSSSFTPNSKAVLELKATDKGFLVPRVDLTGNNSPISNSPVKPDGLLIWNTDATSTGFRSVGFQYWDGSTWQTLATESGTVSGAGTQNYLSKWTPDGATLGNSQLYDNGTNVGLGTSNPAAKLDLSTTGTSISGSAFSTDLLVSREILGGTVGDEIKLASFGWDATQAGDPAFSISAYRYANEGNGRANGSSFILGYDRANTPRDGGYLALDLGGNVGIGTFAPAAQLHTTGSVRFAGLTGASETTALMINGTGDLSTRALNDVAFTGNLPSGDAGYIQNQTSSDQSAGFRINGNGLFNGGKVGIGTTLPVGLLQLKNSDNGEKLTISGSGLDGSTYERLALYVDDT